MTFAKILEDVGDFGAYQKKLLVFFFIPCFTVLPWFSMHVIFLTGIPGHWCYVPEIAKSNLSLKMQKALIMPPSDPHCSMYDVNYTDILLSRNPKFNNETPTKPCDKGWFYENSEFDQTAVTEWDLVCKDDHYVNLLLSTTFMGIFLGSQLFSSLSSKIGRKPTFLISALIITVSDVGSSVSRNFVMVVLLRILQGTAISSIYSTPYALILEIVRPELRTLMNEIATVSWTAGLCLLPMIAWVSRSWVIMSGLNSSCALVLFVCGSVIPESPMWLVTQGQYRKANDILKKMSKLNGKTAHQDDRLQVRVRHFGHEYQRNVADQKKCSARDFFKYPRLRRRFICIAMCWLLNTIPYAGLQMNTRFLEGNKFVNFFLASLVEIPAHFGTWFCIINSGRRWTLLTAFIVAAISCFLIFPLDAYKLIHVLMTFVVKGCTSSAFITLHIQGPELFPLFLKAVGVGLCNTAGAFGGILAPYAVYLHKFGDYAPFMVFSGAMVIATFCASWLPETANKTLPTTVSEAENFEKDWKYFRCTGCPRIHAEESTHRDLIYHIEDENEDSGRRLSPRSTWPALYEMKSETVVFKRN